MKSSVKKIAGACPHDCPDNCSMLYTAENGKLVKVEGNPDHPFTAGRLCVKVNDYHRHHYNPDRVLYPLRRVGPKGAGQFERIDWNAALAEIRDRWNAIITNYGTEAILPYGYAGNLGVLNGFNSGDAFFNHLGATTGEKSFCASSLITAQLMTIGPSLGTDPERFVNAKFIILWGCNTLSTNSHFWTFIVAARRRGAKLIVVDPYRTHTAARADWHVAPRPGTDGALALAMIDTLVGENLLDDDYIERYTVGFDALAARAARYPAEQAAAITGLDADDIRRLAREYATTQPAAIRVGVGMERYPGGGQAIRAIDCLPALVGAWRHDGGGLLQMPVFVPLQQEKLSRPDWINPATRVLNLAQIGELLTGGIPLDPPIQSLFVFNANPVLQAPDSNKIVEGLKRNDLFTVVSEHFVTDTARYADLILPATMAGEHADIQTSWGHFYINYNAQAVQPAGEAVANVELFRRLARTMDFDDPHFEKSDDRLLAEAFDWDHPWLAGKNYDQLKREGFVRVEAPAIPHAEGLFPTPSGKCEFRSELGLVGGFIGPPMRQMRHDKMAGAPIDPVPDFILPGMAPNGTLCLISPKSHGFLNSEYANEAHKLEHQGEQSVVICSEDAAERRIEDGGRVRLSNDHGELLAVARVSDKTVRGTVVASFGYWRSLNAGGGAVNCLSDGKTLGFAGTPYYYDTFIEIEPCET
ncbi:MAG: molybdopterin-dependent oxidoreductase [Pseudomonadota bacterium]|nr:molybdopterin-dependent oxidoreductase [Pseudomonadota bacterium]